MTGGFSRRQFLAGAGAACAASVTPKRVSGRTGDGTTESAAEGGTVAPAVVEGTSDLDAVDETLKSFVDGAVESALEDHDATGAVVTVVRDGSIALTEGYGHAILDENVPIEPDESRFQLGSTVKAVTWTAAMQLADRDMVDPHAAVDDYVTSVPIPDAQGSPITLGNLATHTAGFSGRVVGDKVGDLSHRRPLAETLTDERPPMVRPPDELPAYTNYAAGLGGQLVADVSDVSYTSYVEREIFEPLGMDSATFDPAPDGLGAGQDASYYDEIGWYSDLAPASGMSATATDMAQFLLAHVADGAGEDGRILSSNGVTAMHRQWYTAHERLDGQAFGFLERTRGGTRVLSHSGQVPGFATDLLLVPDEDLGVFVSFQGEQPGPALGAFRDGFLDEYVPVDEAELSPDGRPTHAEQLAGTYRNVHGTDGETYNKLPMAAYFGTVDVRIADDGAVVTDRGGGEDRWVEVEPRCFRRVDGQRSLAFVEQDDGPTALVFGGSTMAYERVSWHEVLGVQARLLVVATLLAISGAAGWPLAAGWRRYRGNAGLSSSARRARWAAGGGVAALAALLLGLVVVGAGMELLGGPSLTSYPPPGFELLFFLPVLSGVATVVAGVYAALAWYQGDWSLPARVHYTAVVVATAFIVWICHYWRLAA